MPVSNNPDHTISEAQARRLWAIALDNGYNRSGVNRLLNGFGYDEATDVDKDDYDELCCIAEDKESAFRYNRDPDTPDMFRDREHE